MKSEELAFIDSWMQRNFELPLEYEQTFDSLFSLMEAQITELIETDLDRLYQLLYRIDIDEEKLKQKLDNNPLTDSSRVITQMIVDRQLEKVKSRKKYS